MRISDWSSDVCSSDLTVLREPPRWSLALFDFAFALAAALLTLLLRPVLALAATGGLLLVWSGVAVMAMMQFLVLPVAVPAIAALLTLGGMLGWRFAVSEDRKSTRLNSSH